MNVLRRSRSSTVLWFHLLQKWLLLTAVEGSGHMALKLMEYKHNTPGKLLSGDCCDGVSGSDCSGIVCDPYFVIRITETNQRTQTVNIQYQTDTLKDVEIITFTDRIGSAPNPVNNSFNVWPGMVEIHITIMDNNTDSGVPDQVIANFTADFSRAHDPLLQNATEFSPLVFIDDPNMTGVSMKATLNVRCDLHYTYDQFCYKFCQPSDNATGHLSCDASGKPSCLPGWMGDPKTGCLQASCSPNPCQNGGRCVSGQGNSLCACAPGFSGRLCEKNNAATSPSALTRPQSTPPGGSGISLAGTGLSTIGQGSATHSPGSGQGSGSIATSGGSGSSGGGNGNNGESGSTGNGNVGGGCEGSGNVGGGSGSTVSGNTRGGSGITTATVNGPINKVNNESSSSSSNLGPIIGGVVGGLAALALLGLLLFLLLRRRKREKKVRPTEEDNVEEMTTEENGDTPKADNSVSA